MEIIYELEFNNGNKVICENIKNSSNKSIESYYVSFNNGETVKISPNMYDKIKIHFNEQYQNSYEDMVDLFNLIGYEINPKFESTNFGDKSSINDHDTLKIYKNRSDEKYYVNWFAGVGRCPMPHNMDPISLIRYIGYNSNGLYKDIVLDENMIKQDPSLRKYYRPAEGLQWGETIAFVIAQAYSKEELEQALDTKVVTKKKASEPKTTNEHLILQNQINMHHSLGHQILNKVANNNKNAYAYLKQVRHIPDEIINKMIDDKMICQSFNISNEKPTANIFFIGYTNIGLYASLYERGASINSSFKRNYAGYHTQFGWFYDPSNPPNKMMQDCYYKKLPPQVDKEKFLLVFEGSIDMMSYMAFLQLNGHDINDYCYLSCGSITNLNCIRENCKLYGFKNVCIFFDNDLDKDFNAGQQAAKKAIEMLEKEFDDIYVISKLPGFEPSHQNYKDWNECLIDNTSIRNNKVVLNDQPHQKKTINSQYR